MGNIIVDISPPSNWQDFERLLLDYAKILWKDDYAERNGRQGQAQAGVDISGYNHSSSEKTGIQCKKKTQNVTQVNIPSNTLTIKEINTEVNNAKSFIPALDRFIIATTGPRDALLQKHARILSDDSSIKFKVSLLFWEDISDFMNKNPKLLYRYYENVLKYRETYNSLEHYLLLLSMAFDRPALRTPFHLETRATDFIEAISATQNAISTGRLEDRQGRIIDQCRVPTQKPADLKKISSLLQKTRDIATKALKDGIIREHPTVIEILCHEIVQQLNDNRFQAINLLNKILQKNGLETIDFAGY